MSMKGTIITVTPSPSLRSKILEGENCRWKDLVIGSKVSLRSFIENVLKVEEKDIITLVNGKYKAPNYQLKDGDVVQVIPPLSGG